MRVRLAEQGGDGCAAEAMEVHVEADHRTAGAFINLNALNVHRMDGEDITVGFAFWRCRAAVARFTKVSTGLQGTCR